MMQVGVGVAGLQRVDDGRAVGVTQEVMPNFRHRGQVAQADAGRAHHAGTGQLAADLQLPQFCIECFRPILGAGDGVAHADDGGGQGWLVISDDVEMGVERRGLIYLGKGQAHFIRQRRQMRGADLMVRVLDEVQMLDQQVADPGAIAKQGRDLMRGLR